MFGKKGEMRVAAGDLAQHVSRPGGLATLGGPGSGQRDRIFLKDDNACLG